jgi:hypothetical protein
MNWPRNGPRPRPGTGEDAVGDISLATHHQRLLDVALAEYVLK